tara:strand:+ start:16006 stop:16962 length:957 start_codon:yes stop_codon:yes gene_type:complete
MKILVIGGAGYIGSHVTYELCDQGYNVTVLDNLSTGFIENVDKRADFIKDSFTNQNIIKKVLKDIDCVIHLAALKAAGESMENPIKYSKHNIIDSISLINSCVENNIDKFIFSSSAAVYGSPQYKPIDEKHPLEPINYYGFTKLIIENQLRWFSQIKNLKVACLRYFNAAGYDVKSRISIKEKNPQNLIPIVMEYVSGLRSEFNVFGNDYNTPDGTCLRDYIHVNDLAIGHVKAIEKLNDKNQITTNLATGNSHSVMDVINEVIRCTNKKIDYKISKRRPGDPDALYAKSNNILNYKNQYSDLETIIRTTWDVYKKYI